MAAAAVAGQSLNSPALQADAVALEHYGAGVGKVLAPLVDASPRFSALLDKLSGDAAPWVAAAMLGLSLGSQLAVNHGLIRPSAVAAFGAVPREQLLRPVQESGLPDPGPAPAPAPEPAPVPAAPIDSWDVGTVPPDWQ